MKQLVSALSGHRRAIPAEAADWFADLAPVRQGRPPLRPVAALRLRENRQVFEVRLGDERAVLKRFVDPNAASRVRRLQAELELMAPVLAEGPLRLVRCLEADPDEGYAIMTLAPGRRLDLALAWAFAGRRARLVGQAAAWLAAYTAPRRRETSFGPAFWRDRCTSLSLDRAHDEDRERLARLAETLGRRAAAHAGTPVLQAATHGDFVPTNLNLARGVLCGYDTEGETWQAVARDVALFLIWLQIAAPIRGATVCGIARRDWEAFLGVGLLPAAEMETTLPFFIGERLYGLLADARRSVRRHARLRRVAEAYLQAPIAP